MDFGGSYEMVKVQVFFIEGLIFSSIFFIIRLNCLLRLVVRTQDFHSCNRGSTPLGDDWAASSAGRATPF